MSLKQSIIANRTFLGVSIAFLLACLGFFLLLLFYPISSQEKSFPIYVKEGESIERLYLTLQPKVRTLWGLKSLAYFFNLDKIKPGRYEVSSSTNSLMLFRKLRNGSQDPVQLCIPKLRTLRQLSGFLSNHLDLDSATLLNHFLDTAFCKEMGYNPQTIIALFLPNTYEIYWNTSLPQLMKRMQKEHRRFWNESRLKKAEKLHLTPIEIQSLASIVEEETQNKEERPIVAGLYYNRLQKGIPLQADPTIKFAVDDFSLKRIYHKLLNNKSLYNTYKYKGLPPGPICIASLNSIEAVLNKKDHSFLYMCAKEDFSGTHNFSSSYQEHLSNAKKYTEALNQNNIH